MTKTEGCRMKKIILGRTDLNVSTLCMGTVPFGSGLTEADSFAMMDHFASLGGNFLDTARVYADWLPGAVPQASERCIGRWLKSRGMQEQFIVATKGGHPPMDRPGRPTLSLAELTEQTDDSRRHLGLDTLPLYYLHRDDPALPVGQIMDVLFALQVRGVIRHIACSNWRADRIREANAYAASCGRPGFVAVSNRWSLAQVVKNVGDPTIVLTDESLQRMHEETQLPLLPFTSMANGYLSKLAEGRAISPGVRAQYDLPENDAIARRAQALGERKGMTVAQVAQCFFYAQAFPVIPVASFSSAAQLEEAAAAADMTLTPQECEWLLNG